MIKENEIITVRGQRFKFLKKLNKKLYLFENDLNEYKECFDEYDVKKYLNLATLDSSKEEIKNK